MRTTCPLGAISQEYVTCQPTLTISLTSFGQIVKCILALADVAEKKYGFGAAKKEAEQRIMFQVPKWRDSKALSKNAVAELQMQIEEEEFRQQMEQQAKVKADKERCVVTLRCVALTVC